MVINYHGTELLSPALEAMCEKKINKLAKFEKQGETVVDVFLTKSGRDFEMKMVLENKLNKLVASTKSEDMYKNIDICVDNLKAQLVDNKPTDKVHRAAGKKIVEVE